MKLARRTMILATLALAAACDGVAGGRDGGEAGPEPDAELDAEADRELDGEAEREGGTDADPEPGDADERVEDSGPGIDFGPEAWSDGLLGAVRPDRERLLALPGGGLGGPVLTSNNPETFTGNGLLYGNARPSPSRGGAACRLEGEFGVYLHHLNHSGSARQVSLLVTNPNETEVRVSGRGSGLTQTETGGLGLGTSPDYRVSEDWILDTPVTVVPETAIAPRRPLVFWTRRLNDRAEVDGRFALRASAPVYVYVVVTSTDDPNEMVEASLVDAPGDYRVSGRPPPPFGREAGVYAHDTWQARFTVALPEAGRSIAWMVNTASGGGLPQVQAFPALAHYDESAAESVGMYGNVYDLAVELVHPGGGGSRRARLTFWSLQTAELSRYWDGLGLVDGRSVVVRHLPASPSTELAVVDLAPGERRTVRFGAMVPGLTTIPQALAIESL